MNKSFVTSTTDGTKINVVAAGDPANPALILGNSLGTDLTMWEPQVDAFSQYFFLIRFDMRGHGASQVPAEPFSLATIGQDVLDIADHFGADRFSYCGLSMGGMTGLWLAAHAPSRLACLIVANCAAFAGGPTVWDQRRDLVLDKGVEAVADQTLERWFTPQYAQAHPETIAGFRQMMLATPRDGYAACCAAIGAFDLRSDLPTIDKPILLIGGEQDTGPPPALIRATAEKLPKGRLEMLNAAHISNHEAGQAFTQLVLQALTQAGN